MIADRHRDARQIGRRADRGVGWNVDRARQHGVGTAPHAPGLLDSRLVDRPVARAAHVSLPTALGLVELVGSDAHVAVACRRIYVLLGVLLDLHVELEVQARVSEIALLHRDPVLEATVGGDMEGRHRASSRD